MRRRDSRRPIASTDVVGSGGSIECQGLRKVYASKGDRVVAIEDLSIDIRSGEFVTLVGPSGCGKTTFLNIVGGFETLTRGSLLIDGQPINGPGPDRGVVFQDYALFPWLTVLENVKYGLLERGVSRAEADAIAHDWLERVGLLKFRTRFPHQLSGGMRQRVAVVRVLANQPRILLLDEPFAALDAFTRRALQDELVALWQQTGTTMIFVTHNLEEAVLLGDRILIMSAHPSLVRQIMTVDLPRPRDVTSSDFNEYRRLAAKELEPEFQRLRTMDLSNRGGSGGPPETTRSERMSELGSAE